MDNDLVIEQTETTPYVEAWSDLQLMCMGGQASAENSRPIFNRINAWLDENLTEFVGGVTLEFNFHYLSPSYCSSVLELIQRLNNCVNDVIDISVKWHCEVDSDIYRFGLELKTISKCNFELAEYYKRFEYIKKIKR